MGRTVEQLEAQLEGKELALASALAQLEDIRRRYTERVAQSDYREALRQVELMCNRYLSKEVL